MKVYFDLQKQAITNVDNENEVIYAGDVLVSKLEVISSQPTTDYYVVVSAKLSNGRTIGPFLYDAGGVHTDSTSTTWEYTLSTDNGFTLCKGLTNFYLWLVPVNTANKNNKCLGAVVVNVGEARQFGDDYFISVDDEEEVEVLTNMKAQIQQLQQLIQSITTIVPNPAGEVPSQDLLTIKIGSVTYSISEFRKFSQNDKFGDVIDEYLEESAPPFTANRKINLICEETGAFIHLEGYQSGADTYVEVYVFGSDVSHLIYKNPTSTTLNFTMRYVIEEWAGATEIYTLDNAFYEIGMINSKIPSDASSDNKLVDTTTFNNLKAVVDKLGYNSTSNIFTPEGWWAFTASGTRIYLGAANTYINNNGTSFLLYDFLISEFTKINQKIPSEANSSNKLADKNYVNGLINGINEKIPDTASSSNQLADKDYVNDQINSVSAYYITKNAQGDAFASVSELTGASTYYSGGVVRVPTRNDYAIVLSDANHDNATTRYSYQGSQWEYQYTINESPMTQPQLNALNSGVTSTKVTNYDNHLNDTNNPHQVTKAQVGLGNVDNTSDENKPISNATQTALDGKADLVDGKLPVSQLPATGVTVDVARALAVGSTGTITGDKVVEDFDKNFYNMGTYDTKSVSNNIVTITRQTGYEILNGSENWTLLNTSDNYLKAYVYFNNSYLKVSASELPNAISNYFNFVTQANYNQANNHLWLDATTNNTYNIGISISTSLLSSADLLGLKAYLSQHPLTIQYKTSTSYTEEVILDQPLNTLDQNGSEWNREEWLKGLNIWDEETQLGYWSNSNGSFVSSNSDLCSKNRTVVLPNTTYSITATWTSNDKGYRIAFYDENDNYINSYSQALSTQTYMTFTTPSNAKYIRFSIYGGYGTTYNHDIMINKGSHAYPYQPYNKSVHITNEEAQFVEDELTRVSSEGAVVHKQELDDKLGNISSVDTGTANVINVLANSERAKLLELSSLSHKSKNKFVIDDIAQTTTASGLTYDMTDGVLTVNGTTTASTTIVIPLRIPIASGTYNIGTNYSGSISDISSGFYNYFNTNADGSGTDFSGFQFYSNNFSVTNTGKSLKLYINNGVTCTNFKLRYSLYDVSEELPAHAEDFEKGSLDLFNSLPTGIRSVGVNVWDEEWEVGGIDADTGNFITDNNSIRSKNYVGIKPSTTYYCKAPSTYSTGRVAFYDSNKTYLGQSNSGWNVLPNNDTFTTPINARYMRFKYGATTYNHDICINVSNASINGTYYPYKEAYIPLVLPEKYAWGINDNCKNKIVWDKDKGIGTPIVNRVNLGDLTYTYQYGLFYATISNVKPTADNNTLANAECSIYKTVIANTDFSSNDKTLAVDNSGTIIIRDTSFTDATTFKQAMDGVYLYYEVASVTQEEIAPLPNFMVEKNGTITIENPLNQDKGYKVMYYLDWINEQLQEAINEADTPVLLWQNGSPTSNFAGQTITLSQNISNFKYMVIEYAYFCEWKNTQFAKMGVNRNPNGTYNQFTIISANAKVNELSITRTFDVSGTTVIVDNCYENSTTTRNELIVPMAIYGTNKL